MSVAAAIFAISLAVCAYVYFGYPALLWILSRIATRPVRRDDILPPVTMVVALHNEEDVIEEKLENALALDYPADRFEIVFASDGSTDATNAIIARRGGLRPPGPSFRADLDSGRPQGAPTIRLLELDRAGKASALNAGVAAASGEIVVFTDANNFLERDAVRMIVRSFADPAVGGVCGNKKLRVGHGADATEKGENLYWKYDQWQKKLESRIGSIFAADGTLYAVRRSLYVPIVDPAQADDIAISTRVVLQGYRLVFEPEAVAFEEAPAEGTAEFRRKVRVTNHSVRALLNLGSALWTSGFYSVELLSHKLVRHLIPFF
ncbi:MAG TPA: glycosyltransferase family 2 protein, partial [Thermoanaerobaculia bacterium]|nr:glycosyltransferase family 2 protein [Thermoanaerobaculia bacterium]